MGSAGEYHRLNKNLSALFVAGNTLGDLVLGLDGVQAVLQGEADCAILTLPFRVRMKVAVLRQSRVTHSMPEKVWDPQHIWHISPDEWHMDYDLGYFLSPSVSIRALIHVQRTLGGVNIPPRDELFWFHDKVGMENDRQVGVGGSRSYGDQLAFSCPILRSIARCNGHEFDHGVTAS